MFKWFDFHKNRRRIALKWLLFTIAIFFVLAGILTGAYFLFEKKYEAKIYPGVFVGQIDLSGLTMDQARMLLGQKIRQIDEQGVIFSYENNQATLFPMFSSAAESLAFPIIDFDIEKSIASALQIGRDQSFRKNFWKKLKTLAYKNKLPAVYATEDREINLFFQTNFSRFHNPGSDAELVYADNAFTVLEEKNGQSLNFAAGLETLKKNLANFDNSSITLEARIDEPQIFQKDCINIDAKAKQVMARAPFFLAFEEERWEISAEQLANWLALKLKPEPTDTGDRIVIGLNAERVEEFLRTEIAPKVNQAPAEAKFEVKDGKVVEFQSSRDGRELNLAAIAQKIEFELTAGCLVSPETGCENGEKEITLITSELKSEIQNDEVNNLGIKEIIGTGHSDFSGSPKNRRHNIAVGAAAVNGTLVKPNDEFSLLKILGEVNAEAGYLTELVIKQGKTIPEYGGGLCQIGTTVFRATTASGLPVTARRNHSYRVSYYEPAGTDATIYDPWPDYRFKNDSPYHVLIQSRIEGDDLYFDFWSTEDGRTATSTYPVIYNIVRPAATRLIETLDLKPGEKKCTERAHNGADAYFDYTVNYPDGEIKEERFSSHYVPWQEVCLLGVESLTVASSTEEVVAE